ncbi:hypothetical protein BGZ98_003428 [Dissophora globulifera]|nr:hypothetical protein BGZ98_003428 [Dissophora globulifera]
MIAVSSLIILLCLASFVGWLFADYFFLWKSEIKSHFGFNEMDFYWSIVCLIPMLLGHFITVWGNYFRASSLFQHSISMVTTPSDKKQRVGFWERHDSFLGFSVKFWFLFSGVMILNIYWFVVTTIYSRPDMIEESGEFVGNLRAVGYGSSQAVMLDCSIILFMVLRRSMLHSLGLTYQDILPMHRWLGVIMLFWATAHGAFYSAWLFEEGHFYTDIAFTDKTRGRLNMPGVFAWFAICIMGFFAIPGFRRKIYPIFLYVHRAGALVFFIGLIMHYPSMMLWYYMLPGFILFLVDRFVPKIIQARSLSPFARCTLNADADIICVKFTSAEPMKPYYPGDYITVQIPGQGLIRHPFTIASYWPEDPYSITLYMRVFRENKSSWTRDLAARFGSHEKRIVVRANVDGVFGDRRHNYLKSETIVIFVAGAALTTFMALIKAIAAQIATTSHSRSMQLHLICTFRTRSELHAYGSFMHQVTHDPRFTSWLHVEIYVSRPEKVKTLKGSHAHDIHDDIHALGHGHKLRRGISGRTIVETSDMTTVRIDGDYNEKWRDDSRSLRHSPSSASTIQTANESTYGRYDERAKGTASSLTSSSTASFSSSDTIIYTETRPVAYDHSLPTFEASSADLVSRKLAFMDLLTTAVLVAVPLGAWYLMRTVHLEGPTQWCVTAKSKDIYTTFVCQWAYALAPGLVHTFVMLMLGYAGIAIARKIHVRHHAKMNGIHDIEAAMAAAVSMQYDGKHSVEDSNWDESDIVYSHGRMDVRKVVRSLVEAGFGNKLSEGQGLVSVLAGGPEGFVDNIERQVKMANWSVDFHRETWAP